MESIIALDAFDIKILNALQNNGGLTNQELAEKIGLSASPCSRRVKILEEQGIKAEETVFLDDNKDNIDSANQEGLHTIWVQKPTDICEFLKDALS